MKILSNTNYTPNGNKYQATKKCAAIGTAVGVAAAAGKTALSLDWKQVSTAPTKHKVALGAIIAGGALFYGAIGRILGSILDDRTNANNAEQTDIKKALAQKETLVQIIEECDCPDCQDKNGEEIIIDGEYRELDEDEECDCPDCQADKTIDEDEE